MKLAFFAAGNIASLFVPLEKHAHPSNKDFQNKPKSTKLSHEDENS